jgi:REP element-mobilizing transposase RayT
VRLRGGLPPLRRPTELSVLRAALAAGSERFGFRLVHFTIQRKHIHLIAEAEDRLALARGMKGLLVRVARALNRLRRRKGSVIAERYNARALRTPREVRHALVYVLQNPRKHLGRYAGIDPGSSGAWFDGWAECPPIASAAIGPPPVVAARSWLL